jgi:hypothetical protein
METSSGEEFKQITENVHLKVNFKPISLVYVVDIIGRITLCTFYFINRMSVWLFLVVFLVSMIIEGVVYNRIQKMYETRLKEKIGEEKLKNFSKISLGFAFRDTLGAVYSIIGLIASFWFFTKIIVPEHWYTYLLILLLAIMGMVVFVITSEFVLVPKAFDPTKFLAIKTTYAKRNENKEQVIETPVTTDVSHQFTNELLLIEKVFNQNILVDEMDVNDTEIARLESDLKDVQTKVESYMLESVLIGSLTFSGFLTIIASGVMLKPTQLGNTNLTGLTSIFVTTNPAKLLSNLDRWISSEKLFTAIMFESLFCSVFFILVLALRMRFAQLTLKLDYLLRIMTIFNAKEEELINMEVSGIARTKAFDFRRKNLAYKISEAINDANKLVKDIKPLTRLMGVYRNIGLILFFLILTTSGCFFSAKIGFSIFLIAIITWLFRVIETWRTLDKIQRLVQRH